MHFDQLIVNAAVSRSLKLLQTTTTQHYATIWSNCVLHGSAST